MLRGECCGHSSWLRSHRFGRATRKAGQRAQCDRVRPEAIAPGLASSRSNSRNCGGAKHPQVEK